MIYYITHEKLAIHQTVLYTLTLSKLHRVSAWFPEGTTL